MQVARQGSGRRRSSRSSRKVSISVRVYSTLNPNPAPSRPFSPRVSSRPAPLGSRWGQRKPYDGQSGQPRAFTIAPAPAFSDPRTRLHPSFPGPPRVNSPRETRERAHRVTRQRSDRREERRDGCASGGIRHLQGLVPRGWLVRGSQALEAEHRDGLRRPRRSLRDDLQLQPQARDAAAIAHATDTLTGVVQELPRGCSAKMK